MTTNNDTFSILFYIRKERINKKGGIPIYCRITINGKRADLSLKKYFYPPLEWDKHASKVRGRSEQAKIINEQIRKSENSIRNFYSDLFERNQVITSKKLKDLYLGKEEDRKTIIEIFEYHNNQIKEQIGVTYAKATHTRYETTKKHIQDFMLIQYDVNDMYLKEVGFKFINEFEVYLLTVRKCDNNTVIKYIRNFKKITNLALKNEWINKDPFIKYEGKLKPVKREFLTIKELNQIESKTFKIERLEHIKDCFLFSCYTGLAYSDLAKLSYNEIYTNDDGLKYISLPRTKTKVESFIPLDDKALYLIEKYKDHPKLEETNKVIPTLSNQKTNSYLKEIADLCGITRNLTFHLSRHTFATHRLHY